MATSEEKIEEIDKPYEALPHQKSNYSLFSDPKLKEAFNSLPKEDQEKYQKSGQYMYSYDYVNQGNPDDKIYESVAHIAEGLKSGLRPSQLDDSERTLIKSVYGDQWFTRYGYTSEQD